MTTVQTDSKAACSNSPYLEIQAFFFYRHKLFEFNGTFQKLFKTRTAVNFLRNNTISRYMRYAGHTRTRWTRKTI